MAVTDASLPAVPGERLPDVLTNELPAAELSALRLDATLVPFANAFLVADALGDAADRIRGAFGQHSPRLIAELDTAAWVWGARHSLPARFEFCASLAERARLAPGALDAVREVAISDDEIVTIAGRRVTSPVRTAIDLARFRDDGAYSPEIVAALLALADTDAPTARAVMDSRRHLTHAERARRRLRDLACGPELSRR